MDEPTDLPALLRQQAERRGPAPAMRQKHLGIWRSWTWHEVADETARLAGGLAARGVGPGERVLLSGSARPQLLMALLALQSLGAVPVLPTDEGAPALLHGIRFAFAGGQRAAETLLQAAAGTALTVFAADSHSIGERRRGSLESYQALLTEPAIPGAADAGRPALILSASDGTAERALRAAELLEATGRAALTLGSTADDRMLAFLPLGCLPALLLGPVQSLLTGFPLFFPESEATILADLREAGPSLLAAPPLLLRQIRRAAFLRSTASGAWWRRLLQTALDAEGHGPKPRGLSRLLGDALIRRPVRDQAGLGRVRRVVSFGPPMPPALGAFYDALGIGQVTGEALLFPGQETAADPLETALRGSLFLRDACAVGTPPAVLAWLDEEAVAAWAQSAGLAIAGTDELATHPDVQALVAGEIVRATAPLPAEIRPARFAIAPKLSRAAGEIGQDGGLQRAVVLRDRAAAFAALRDGVDGRALAPPPGEERLPTPRRVGASRRDLPASVAA